MLHPALFLQATRQLDVSPGQAAVVENSLADVQAAGDPDANSSSGSTGTTKEEPYEPPTPVLSSPIWRTTPEGEKT